MRHRADFMLVVCLIRFVMEHCTYIWLHPSKTILSDNLALGPLAMLNLRSKEPAQFCRTLCCDTAEEITGRWSYRARQTLLLSPESCKRT
ncbi:hypothetical protein ARMGADRAFT_131723 [Armillaria gallica]|uniref:Secreted protein n=1 Tax=Armillaria gallica TaxID=47427 RepID=A0A2H3DIK2_ARMGA|nr:hypothetical protein ARMGADRAFT_131723 [Armillaria gallica]